MEIYSNASYTYQCLVVNRLMTRCAEDDVVRKGKKILPRRKSGSRNVYIVRELGILRMIST